MEDRQGFETISSGILSQDFVFFAKISSRLSIYMEEIFQGAKTVSRQISYNMT